MKKIITILFLTSFFLLQYGKVVSYLYCTYDNYQQTGAVTCDCEKKLTDEPANTPAHNGHLHHLKTEDCLPHTAAHNLLPIAFIKLNTCYRAYQENILHNPLNGLLRPPCTS